LRTGESDSSGGSAKAWLEQHPGSTLAALLVLAAVVRVVRWQVTAAMFNDGPVFLAIAQAMEAGEWSNALGHPFHPLYPAAIAAFHLVIPDWEVAAVTVSVLSGTIAVACLWGFVHAAFGPVEAALAGLLLAVHSLAIEYSGDIQSEGLYLALFLAAAWVLWRALDERSPALAGLGGLLSGAAYLARPEGLGIAMVGAGIAASRGLRGSWPSRLTAGWLAALMLGSGLCVAPYLGWLRFDQGEWSLSGKKSIGVVTGVVADPHRGPDPLAPEPLQRDAARLESPQEELSSRDKLSAGFGELVRTHVRTFRYEILVLLLAAALLSVRPPLGTRGAFVLAVVSFYALLALGLATNVGYLSARHVFPGVTLTFGYAALGLLALSALLGGSSTARVRGIARLLVVLVVAIGLGKALNPDRLDSLAERRAAEWLAAQRIEVGAVAARKRRVAYYARAPWVKLATAAFPAGLRQLGATHLILNEEDWADYGYLRALEPPQARLLHRTEAAGEKALVFELLAGIERAPADR